jgi:hypothetical protein
MVGKMHPHNLFIDNGAVSCHFPKERETQIDSLLNESPDQAAAKSPRTIRAESIRNCVRVLTGHQEIGL